MRVRNTRRGISTPAELESWVHDLTNAIVAFKSALNHLGATDQKSQTLVKDICADGLKRLSGVRSHIQAILDNSADSEVLPKEHVQAGATLALIDDDQLIHQMWSLEAAERGFNLLAFNGEEEFLEARLTTNISIYIDKHLKSGVSGFDVARRLFEKGFRDIFITTGDATEMKQGREGSYVRAILGKEFPIV